MAPAVEEERVPFVVDRFNAMLADDGARLEVEAGTREPVGLRYVAGPGGPGPRTRRPRTPADGGARCVKSASTTSTP